MCARVSVKFRSWPTNQDTRGSNLVGNVGKNRINNRVNRYSSCFFFSFFLWIQSIILRDTLTKYNEKKWKKKKKRERKNNLRKAIWTKRESCIFSIQRKIKLLARFSHSNFSILRWNRSIQTLSVHSLPASQLPI